MKLLGKIVMLLVAALAVLVLARNGVVKATAENGVRIMTGMPLSIGKLDLGLTSTRVDLETLVVKNPAGFHNTVLVDIPKILVDYDLFDILKGKVHLENLEFDMKQFTVVKNEKGELNLDRLRALQGTPQASASISKPGPKAPAKAVPIQIDMMHFKIDKVVYVDYSGGQPSTKEFRMNLDQSYQNITDLNSIVRLIVLKVMINSGISNLVNFDIGGLEGTLTGAFNTSTKLAAQTAAKSLSALKTVAQDPSRLAGKTGDMLGTTTGAVGDTAKGLTREMKNAAGTLRNKLKIPF